MLSGGACASIHSGESYVSEDVDFVLEGDVRVAELDAAMASIGFERAGNLYVHSASRFWVEFPRGPLAIGNDLEIRARRLPGDDSGTLALSPTDSVRDRLAAFYHWNDRQSLAIAISIAERNRIDLKKIERWSAGEGHPEKYLEFRTRLSKNPRTRR